MRHILSTALVALIVGAIAGATVGALAQDPATGGPAAIEPAAVSNINADRVDGKHAVSASATLAQRKNKLVATNTQGYLPSNIVKPAWSLISGVPAGFADGIDNTGVTKLTVSYAQASASTAGMAAGDNIRIDATCASGKVVGGGAGQNFYGFHVLDSKPNIPNGWQVWYEKAGSTAEGESTTLVAYAICLTTTPSGGLASKGGKAPAGKR